MKHLTSEQRYTISVLKDQGLSQKKIAQTIKKDESTVSRELRRNCDQRSGKYRYELASRKCQERHSSKNKAITFTFDIQMSVEQALRNDFSPEQIAGRFARDGLACVSHERIYQHVWSDKKKGGNLHQHLRHQGRKYRKRGAAKDSRGIIKNRVDISQRPAIVDDKLRVGDLEIDTVIGKNHKEALLTINDRVSSFVFIEKLNGKNANELADKAIEVLSKHKQWLHTITADNGKEFAEHTKISTKLKTGFFFARPYHSWERGANENTNGLIRQYFPKGSSFENITNQQVKEVQNILNNRPRKKLNFATPYEFLLLNLKHNNIAFTT